MGRFFTISATRHWIWWSGPIVVGSGVVIEELRAVDASHPERRLSDDPGWENHKERAITIRMRGGTADRPVQTLKSVSTLLRRGRPNLARNILRSISCRWATLCLW